MTSEHQTDRYAQIKKRLLEAAEKDENITAVIAIGSSVRSSDKADEYSDLDLIMACRNPNTWLYGDEPAQLGAIKISFVEPTLGGGKERRILYDGALDVDMIILTPEQLINAAEAGVASEVMNRGYCVMYDSMGITAVLERCVETQLTGGMMDETEFLNMCGDFWFHIVWASKKILRGELWSAKMNIDAYLKRHLLKAAELYERASNGKDVWHDGRFFEKWAGRETLKAMEGCFAHYEREDMISALIATAELFGKLTAGAAEICGYSYPHESEQYALTLLNVYFKR